MQDGDESFVCAGRDNWDLVFVGDDSVDYFPEHNVSENVETPINYGRLRPIPGAPFQTFASNVQGNVSASTLLNRLPAQSPESPSNSLGYKFVIKEVNGEGAVRSYAYCTNQAALSAAVMAISPNDLKRLSSQHRPVRLGECDDVELVSAVIGQEEYLQDTEDQLYHVKAYDVMEVDGHYDLIILLTRQVQGHLSGSTSLCSIRSSRMTRSIDLMDYTISCVDYYSDVPMNIDSVDISVTKLMDNYGRVVPIRALHNHLRKPVKIKEIVLENNVSWFYATKEAVLSVLDRTRLMVAAHEHSLQVEGGDKFKEIAKMEQNSLGLFTRLDAANVVFSHTTVGHNRRGLMFDSSLKVITHEYGKPEELLRYSGHSREFGPLQHAVLGEQMPVLLSTNGDMITKMFFCNIVAYDACYLDNTWDVVIVILCIDKSSPAMFASAWGERRMAYLQYSIDASSVSRNGSEFGVIRRDSSIKELSKKYNGFVPIEDFASMVIKPIKVRECLIHVNDVKYISYQEINSYVSDIRVLVSRSSG